MSVAAAMLDPRSDAALSAFVRATDAYYMYWRAKLSSELMSTPDTAYATRLRQMLERLQDDQMILPRRCRRCGQYFDQPMPATLGPWRKFCGPACRKQYPREVLR
jgi:hypothetical protein